MLTPPALAAILPTLPTVPVVGQLHRVVNFEHFESGDPSQFLFDQGPLRSREGQRFTPAVPDGFPCIYAAEDLVTAGCEFAGSRAQWNLGNCPNHVGFKIDIELKQVLDLTHWKIRNRLGTTLAGVLEPWLGFAKVFGYWPPTWDLGRAVYDYGQIDGIRFPSEKNQPEGRNLLVLTSCLATTRGKISILNSDDSIRERLPVYGHS